MIFRGWWWLPGAELAALPLPLSPGAPCNAAEASEAASQLLPHAPAPTLRSATTYGAGRAVHFGHEGMLGTCCPASGLGRLARNAVSWAGGGKATIRVASTSGFTGLATALASFVSAGYVRHA